MAVLARGAPAPDFSLPDQHGNLVRLSDFRGRWVVVYFYPKDMTPGCTQEACSFRDLYEDYQQEGIVVLGISADDVESHRKFAEKYGLPFPLLADTEHKVSEAYGAWGKKHLYGKLFWGVERITYVIAPDGTVYHVFTRVKPASHGDEVLTLIRQAKSDEGASAD
ncbi:MAG: thioredoxin-dependent thiol peroxidase [Armatimonadota bacterium]|nr:thioredoxin-dependent thiol peroxidase [Armatimonadota bacterium]